jgi:hypothetical protein
VNKPRGAWWFKVHPDPAWRFHGKQIKLQRGLDVDRWLVLPELAAGLDELMIKDVTIYFCINTLGDFFLWDVQQNTWPVKPTAKS